MRLQAFIIPLTLILCACGSPRGDGIPWEKTYPHSGDTVSQVDALYGTPRNVEHREDGSEVRNYSNWRVKNEFNGMMHRSDWHSVQFKDGKTVAWH
jgi:hypothetical protein